MSTVQDYPSRMGDPKSRRFETFSYLPEMDASQIRQQVQHIVNQGWDCAIEHVEPARTAETYWYLWKLPMFGERGVDIVMNELTACHNANPGHHVRLVGYDNKRQTQGMAIVVYRGDV